MELKDVMVSAFVAVVCIIAVFSWTNNLNAYYGTDIGSTFNATLDHTKTITGSNITQLGMRLGNNSLSESGAAAADQNENLLKRAASSFGILSDILGIIPSMLYDGASILQIPVEYQTLAVTAFLAVVALTLAYILLLGVKKLLG